MLSIALAATACTAIANLRNSPLALITICCSTAVMCPFVLIAGAIMGFGLLCCMPVVLIGLACAWLPTILRLFVTAARIGLNACKTGLNTSALMTYLSEHPGTGLAMIACALPLIPVVLVSADLHSRNRVPRPPT